MVLRPRSQRSDTTQTSRRSFLGRTSRWIAAAAAAKLGLAASEAYAITYYKCCELCFPPTGGTCSNVWCWRCCNDLSNGYGYTCCECFSAGYSPGDTCFGAYRSFAYQSNPNCLR